MNMPKSGKTNMRKPALHTRALTLFLNAHISWTQGWLECLAASAGTPFLFKETKNTDLIGSAGSTQAVKKTSWARLGGNVLKMYLKFTTHCRWSPSSAKTPFDFLTNLRALHFGCLKSEPNQKPADENQVILWFLPHLLCLFHFLLEKWEVVLH